MRSWVEEVRTSEYKTSVLETYGYPYATKDRSPWVVDSSLPPTKPFNNFARGFRLTNLDSGAPTTYLTVTGPTIWRVASLFGLGSVSVDSIDPRNPSNFHHAMLTRQRVASEPDKIRPSVRHMNGYARSLAHVYSMLEDVSDAVQFGQMKRFAENFGGAKRAMYEKAYAYFRREGSQITGRLTHAGFVKSGETKLREEGVIKPRAIIVQEEVDTKTGKRYPTPIMVEGCARKTQQHHMHLMCNPSGSPIFATFADAQQRAVALRDIIAKGKVVVKVDLTSFDGSEDVKAERERAEFLGWCKRHDYKHMPSLERVMRAQNVGDVVHKGNSYCIGPNRASGTAGTAVGNKFVMLGALHYSLGLDKHWDRTEIYCDGDDTCIGVDPEQLVNLPRWIKRMSKLGFETKVEGIYYTLEELAFCRATPFVRSDGEFIMVKDPVSAFVKTLNVFRHFKGSQWHDYLATVRSGYTRLWTGIPILWTFGALYPGVGVVRNDLLTNSGLDVAILHTRFKGFVPITLRERTLFANQHSISIAAQLEIENLILQAADEIHSVLLNRTW